MAAVVVDSSVVIGLIRSADAAHHVAAAEIQAARVRGDDLVLPATVLAESTVGAYRVNTRTGDELRDDLVGLFGPVHPVDEAVAVSAARLRARHRSLRLPDALVIATAEVVGALVLTCDKRLGPVDDRVHVVSP